MKKIKMFFLSFLFILSLCITNNTFASIGTVTGSTVRIRENADVSSNIVTNAYRNDTVNILEDCGEWYKVEYEGETGYISKSFVNVQEENAIPSTEPVASSTTTDNTSVEAPSEPTTDQNSNSQVNPEETQTTENTENSENNQTIENSEVSKQSNTTIEKETYLKVLPNFTSREVGKLEVGTQIEVQTEVNNWIKIIAGTNTGWILKSNAVGYELNSNIVSTNVDPESNNIENTDNTTDPNTENIENENNPENDLENNPDNNPENNLDETQENQTEPTAESTGDYEKQTGYINTDTVRIRETAGGKIIGNLDINDVVTILGEEGDWYQISCDDFANGYVSKSLVTIGKVPSRNLTEERTSEEVDPIEALVEASVEPKVETVPEVQQVEEPQPQVAEVVTPESVENVNKGNEVVEYAKSFLGSRYVSGGTSPNGFDCSGFTQFVYAHFGYSIARVASAQSANGVEVSRENLQLGDLILFQDSGRTMIGHVAIYIGDGNFIHAANPSRGVVIDNLNTNSYYNIRFVTARRII